MPRIEKIRAVVFALAVGLVAMVFAVPSDLSAWPARFGLTRIAGPAPMGPIAVWAPKKGEPADGMLTLLHGSQGANTPDPTWLAWMRNQTPFNRWVLIVPSIPPGVHWTDKKVVASLAALVDLKATQHSIPLNRSYVFGFSAGGSQGIPVVATLADRFAGVAVLAGFPSMGSLSVSQRTRLASRRVLLMCGSRDPSATCASADAAQRSLAKSGITNVARIDLAGLGHDCPVGLVGPALATWIGAK